MRLVGDASLTIPTIYTTSDVALHKSLSVRVSHSFEQRTLSCVIGRVLHNARQQFDVRML